MDSFEERVRATRLDPRWDVNPEGAKKQHRLTMAAAAYANGGRFEDYMEMRGGLPDPHRAAFEQAHGRVLALLGDAEPGSARPSLTWIPNAPARLEILRRGSESTIVVSHVFITELRSFAIGWRRWRTADRGVCGKHPLREQVEAMAVVALAAAIHPAYIAFATHERCRECRHLLNADRSRAAEIEGGETEAMEAASAFALLHEIGHAVRGDLATSPAEGKSHDEIAADLWAIDRMPEIAGPDVWPEASSSVLLLAAAAEALGGGREEAAGIARRRLDAGVARIADRAPGAFEPAAVHRGLAEVVEAGARLRAAVDPTTLFLDEVA